ncbi:MAG: hypothetical protein KA338_20815 [Chloroflexi bacterium]|nr:hypothetical protein [Chloroflexota bacterium]
MTTDNLTHILDIAVTRWQKHEPWDDLIEMDDTKQAEALPSLLGVVATLDLLQPVEMPTEEAMVNDRNAFLSEIAHWQLQAVSPTGLKRLKEWLTNHRLRLSHRSPWLRKEKPLMNSILAKFVMIFALTFVAIGGTAAAESLPDSTLYPVKLVMEDTQLALTQDPAHSVDLYLTFAQERIEEMAQMARAGVDPGEATVLRLENHLQNAMVQSAQLSDNTALLTLLEQMQQTVQTQSQLLAQSQLNVSAQTQTRLIQAQTICNQVLAEVETGLQDPALFRERHTGNRPEGTPPWPEMTPRPNSTATPDGTPNCADCTPTGDAHQYGPQPTQPGPGGPGGNPNATPQPTGTAYQNGPQPTQAGPGGPGGNPNATPQPTGTAYQNGPQPTQAGPGGPGGNPNATPQPTGTAYQNGPQPTQAGPGGPGGNPNATPQPTGTAHQNGPQPTQAGPGQPGGNPNATPQATCTAIPQGTQTTPSGTNGTGGNFGH